MKKKITSALVLLIAAGAGVYIFLNIHGGHQLPPRTGKPVPQVKSSENHDSSPLTNVVADRILISKKARKLTLFRNGKPLKTYLVALGRQPAGAKTMEGDGKTPEGSYIIDRRNPHSQFHRALHISYPDTADRRRAAARGVSPGGDIMIHGLPNGMGKIGAMHRAYDWTEGCIALTDEEIDEVWRVAPNGTRVDIVP